MQTFLLGLSRFTIFTDFTIQNSYDAGRYVLCGCTQVTVKLFSYFWMFLTVIEHPTLYLGLLVDYN